jgi:PAS domain-containing protein
MQITKFKSEMFIALEQMTVCLQRGKDTLKRLVTGGARGSQKPEEALRADGDDLREFSPHAITKFKSEMFIALEGVMSRLQRGQNRFKTLVGSVASNRQKLQDALRVRDNGLRRLLASSLNAIVVTNRDHCLIVANPKALDLFGISEANMKKFTLDAFLPHRQILSFAGGGPPFIRREAKHGKCKIRRLDGSVRIVEYDFVANFVPLHHLYRFRDVTPKSSGAIYRKIQFGPWGMQTSAS